MSEKTTTTYLYRHFDAEGKLLYVGISLQAINRLAQHRDNAHWFSNIRDVKIEVFESRQDALAAERKAILEENPSHNIQRPSAKEQRAITQEFSGNPSEESRKDLVKRLVNFNPVYSIREVAEILGIGPTSIEILILSGQLGCVKFPPKKINTRYGEKEVVKTRITGWQIIEYLEWLEHQSAPKRAAI